MHVAHEKLTGLDRDRILAIVTPVLRAHGVEGVELVWKTDRAGWLLELTIERPDSRVPGAGITIDVCSEISRDLSAALDLADVIPQAYRLEVGSPGLDRALYSARDYQRFAGQLAKVKLKAPQADGQRVLRGTLHGLDEAGQVLIDTDSGLSSIALEAIDSGRLVFDWKTGATPKAKSGQKGQHRANKARKKSHGSRN